MVRAFFLFLFLTVFSVLVRAQGRTLEVRPGVAPGPGVARSVGVPVQPVRVPKVQLPESVGVVNSQPMRGDLGVLPLKQALDVGSVEKVVSEKKQAWPTFAGRSAPKLKRCAGARRAYSDTCVHEK